MEKTKQSLANFEKQWFFDEWQILENSTKKLIHKIHCQIVKVKQKRFFRWKTRNFVWSVLF